ncbi:hypothetical protein, partial [Streptomyces sp. NPDC005167]
MPSVRSQRTSTFTRLTLGGLRPSSAAIARTYAFSRCQEVVARTPRTPVAASFKEFADTGERQLAISFR